MDLPEQSKVPDVPEGGVSHAANPGRDKSSCDRGWEWGAWLWMVQQLNVDILDNIWQQAVNETPHPPGMITLDVVMIQIRQDHLWGNVEFLKCRVHRSDVVILNLIEQVAVTDVLQLRVDMSVRVSEALLGEIVPGVLYHGHQLSQLVPQPPDVMSLIIHCREKWFWRKKLLPWWSLLRKILRILMRTLVLMEGWWVTDGGEHTDKDNTLDLIIIHYVSLVSLLYSYRSGSFFGLRFDWGMMNIRSRALCLSEDSPD